MEFSRESIFHSSIRSFSHMFFGIIGFFLALIPVFLVFALISSNGDKLEKTSITYLQDLEGNNTILPNSTPVILQINIQGIIGSDEQNEETLRLILNDSQKGVLKNHRVKGILLSVNSPGGSASASDGMYSLIQAYKEKYHIPVYAYVDGICASGGYMISCCAEKIFSSPCSMIGSVGVLSGPFFNVYDALKTLGITTETLTRGKNKDMLNPFRPWKEGEDLALQDISDAVYKQFVSLVSSQRPLLTQDKLINEYGAGIFSSETAKEHGYIDDGNMRYSDALKELLTVAKIDESSPYQLIELKSKRNRWKEILNCENPLFKGRLDHIIHIGAKEPILNEPVLCLYRP